MTSHKTDAPKSKPAQQSSKGGPAPLKTDLPPLKPRPGLFIILAIILVIWLGTLGVMRLKTVIRPSPDSPATLPLPSP